ncbi:MAG: hypothetical protein ACREMW_15675 [Gemmatimonadales bacterium]
MPSPVDVGLDERGRVYVLDREASAVRVFSHGGATWTTLDPASIGHPLSRGAWGMAVAGSGAVYVWDPQRQGILVFPPSPRRPFSFTVLGRSYGLPVPIEVSDSAEVMVSVLRPGPAAVQETAIFFDQRGRRRRDLGPFPVVSSMTVTGRSTRSTVTLPFDLATRTVLALAPTGDVAMADSRGHHVSVVRGTDTLFTAAHAGDEVPVLSGDVKNALALAPTGISERDVRRLLPRSKSPIVELLLSTDWLLVRRPVLTQYTHRTKYDLYRIGSSTPCVTLVLAPRILAARGQYLAGISLRDAGTPAVEVLRLWRLP